MIEVMVNFISSTLLDRCTGELEWSSGLSVAQVIKIPRIHRCQSRFRRGDFEAISHAIIQGFLTRDCNFLSNLPVPD